MTTHTLPTDDADLVYDIHGPAPTPDGPRPLVAIGQPMDARGFTSLAERFPDRPVITYDPRGIGRSVRKDGRTDHDPNTQAGDVHQLIAELGVGPVDVFGSSGGAVVGLALVTAFPDDVHALVAHEPPLLSVVPDAEAAERARTAVRDVYQAKGFNYGMAAFIGQASWHGEYTDEYFAMPVPGPEAFGMPTEDDGKRDDPLLSDLSWAVSSYRIDPVALAAAPTRVVIAVGEESAGTFTDRSSRAAAALLGRQPAVFPSNHSGFMGDEYGYPGKPDEFAVRLREVLDGEASDQPVASGTPA